MTALVLFLTLAIDDSSACAMPYERPVVAKVAKPATEAAKPETRVETAATLADVLAEIDAAVAVKPVEPAPAVIAEATEPTS
jgi:hypothetical protein